MTNSKPKTAPAPVCPASTTNPSLQAWIESNGALTDCGRCGTQHKAADARKFAEHIDDVIRGHTTPIVHQSEEDSGEEPIGVIKREAGVDESFAQYVTEVGRERTDEDICYYDYNLSFTIRFGKEKREDWKRVREIVRHEARFFGQETRELLDRLLGDVETICGGTTIRTLTPKDVVFRGRLAHTRDDAKVYFEAPSRELIAPPKHKAAAGRMNAFGVRVFYGALSESFCVAEVRPPLSSAVVTAKFRPTRDLRILDLGSLGSAFSGAYSIANVFNPDFDLLSEKLEFLRALESEIARPIVPIHEALEYIPTQVIAEYLAHIKKLDGIAYRSAQDGDASQWRGIVNPALKPDARNVALFGDAARTVGEEDAGPRPGLQLEDKSAHMLHISKIEIKTEDDVWVHYPDPPAEDDD